MFYICPNDCLFDVVCSDQVGNRKLLEESGISISTEVESFVVELEESAKTGILVACNGILIGVLGVADSLKREASVVIEGLQKMGITPVMVTGDNWRTARAVAKEVCIYFLIYFFRWKYSRDNFECSSKAIYFLVYALTYGLLLVLRKPTSFAWNMVLL